MKVTVQKARPLIPWDEFKPGDGFTYYGQSDDSVYLVVEGNGGTMLLSLPECEQQPIPSQGHRVSLGVIASL